MDIFSLNELLLVAFVALLVIGPERLPETLRTLGLWIGRLTRSFNSVKAELEKEIGMDEIRRQLHNESVMEEMKRIEREVKNSVPPDLDKEMVSNLESQANGELSEQGTDQDAEQNADQSADQNIEKDIAPPPEPDITLPAQENTIDPNASNAQQQDEPAPETPTVAPRSEAELEAMHARRAKQAANNKTDNG